MTQKLAGMYLDLVKPKMIMRRWDVLFAFTDASRPGASHAAKTRVYAGALGLCWPEIQRHIPPYDGNLLMWSEHVMQYLVEHGADISDIPEPGAQAVDLCVIDIPGAAPDSPEPLNVSAASVVGNSEAPAGA